MSVTRNLSSFIPGDSTINTIGKMYPNNAATRPNTINGTDLQNSLGSFPKNMDIGLAKQLEDIRLLEKTFEPSLLLRGMYDYRQIFSKDTIPLHAGTLVKSYIKHTGIDERPETAAVSGLTGWDPTWTEVAIQGSAIEVTCNIYGRFYKKHKWADNISTIDWFGQLAMEFQNNAARTLNNLAGYRLFQYSNKIFGQSLAAFDPANPLEPRLTLGASAADVDTFLTWDHLRVAKHSMQNFIENYTVVNGATVQEAQRRSVIPGYIGQDYLVLVGRNGYDQLLEDQRFLQNFVVNGGVYAPAIHDKTLGITSSYQNFKIQIVDNPITISKEATPKVSSDGIQPLEVAFVIGRSAARIGIELTLEGSTQIISVGYEEDKKIDPFGLFAMVGWTAGTDFGIIHPECVYAIPYKQASTTLGGNVVAPTLPSSWKK